MIQTAVVCSFALSYWWGIFYRIILLLKLKSLLRNIIINAYIVTSGTSYPYLRLRKSRIARLDRVVSPALNPSSLFEFRSGSNPRRDSGGVLITRNELIYHLIEIQKVNSSWYYLSHFLHISNAIDIRVNNLACSSSVKLYFYIEY